MNILFINSIAKHKFGGGEKWMLTAAKGLAKQGHRVWVAGKKNGQFLHRAAGAGLRTEALTIHSDIGPFATWRIYRFCRRNAIEVMICNLNKDVRVGGLGARFARVPVVLARHGILLCGKKWKHRITLTKLTDGIITNTRTIKDAYAGYGWFNDDFVKVIYNGVEDKSQVVPHDYGREYPGKKIVMSAGRLSEQKGYEYLIDAAKILFSLRSDLVFVVAGAGSLEKQLRRRVADAGLDAGFFFIGYLPDTGPHIKGCDVFVLPSLFEGMPNAVMEAMACGRAVVATDVNGAGELIGNDEGGCIVPPRNAEALAAAINKLLDDRALRERCEKNALARVLANFTIDAMTRNLEAYLLDKLKSSARR